MAVSASPYGKFVLALFNGYDLSGATLTAMLTTNSYTPDVDTDEFADDVTNEITGTGYTAGGEALTNVAITHNTTESWVVLTADPVIWTGATFTARRAVIYDDTGTAGTSRLIGYVDFGADRSPNLSNEFVLNFTLGVVRARLV